MVAALHGTFQWLVAVGIAGERAVALPGTVDDARAVAHDVAVARARAAHQAVVRDGDVAVARARALDEAVDAAGERAVARCCALQVARIGALDVAVAGRRTDAVVARALAVSVLAVEVRVVVVTSEPEAERERDETADGAAMPTGRKGGSRAVHVAFDHCRAQSSRREKRERHAAKISNARPLALQWTERRWSKRPETTSMPALRAALLFVPVALAFGCKLETEGSEGGSASDTGSSGITMSGSASATETESASADTGVDTGTATADGTADTGECLPLDSPCADSEECCSGACDPMTGSCVNLPGGGMADCAGDGEPCVAAAQCCTLACHDEACGGEICRSKGESCEGNSD
jgi:hypothetical protein